MSYCCRRRGNTLCSQSDNAYELKEGPKSKSRNTLMFQAGHCLALMGTDLQKKISYIKHSKTT